MTEVVVLDVSPNENLQEFSQYLWGQGVSHRILELDGRQLLLVGDKATAQQARSAYEQMQTDPSVAPVIQLPESPEKKRVFATLIFRLPVTLSLVLLSIIGFTIVTLDTNFDVVRYLTFYDFELDSRQIVFSLSAGQYWRLITPIFLHFGIMHIAFNMALLWFVGQRIELLQGSMRMFGIVFVVGLGSNIVQAMLSGAAIFGGMSGVVYGLLGYGWVWSAIHPDKHLHIPSALIYFSLFMLVMGFVGVVDLLGPGRVANSAHLGGLIMGCIIGLGTGLMSKSVAK